MTSILITGANRGIGFALAKAALARGWTVYGSARSADQAEIMAKDLPGLTPLVFDVTDRAAIAAAAAQVDGSLDILINNAGIIGPSRQSTLDMDFDGFLKTLEVNTVAPLAVAQAFLPKLKASGSGRILSVSSQMSWMGYRASDRIAYRASKSALNKVMQGLATDLTPDRIPVVVIDPGWVKTDMGGSAADNDPARVAEGILAIADELTISVTGTFFKWTGEERPF
ncbi:SDR family oxidoreductase [Roseibium suaedae]|uniref:Short-chain dehydrogenase n=1 Tax=Roseibium suaedae TaxID=735517 RepID=A0A1M7CQI4_9HYPH|nr:SDR family oxidoreductase [Roseibium suaedae]SHL69452.1 Short-chain dehydrogenase [Roseibium suaedae]